MVDINSALDLALDNEQLEKFELFFELLVSWNQKFNLTSITQKDEVYLKHFVDSLSAQKYLKYGSSVLDIGSGAGFPGIPLAIARPDLRLVLIDSLKKRIGFLEHCKSALNLSFECLHCRAEDFKGRQLGKIYEKASFDAAVSRAVAPLNTLLEYAIPFVRTGGIFIAYKSSNVSQEIISAKNALLALNAQISDCPSFVLPNSDIARSLIIVKKLRATPSIYPRGGNKPKTHPL